METLQSAITAGVSIVLIIAVALLIAKGIALSMGQEPGEEEK